ncbi:hypothetical protein EOD41_10835 [Mucilaginibacter limnophilus]|uniref:Uncharacterized protein n=1 Tax=Mucilaginibacter limnophilus TaxID=1932778 RepID=A0A3S2V1Z9_9SPHI|nr:hypothetical protein [Mucilaginibacter limnophilus]RVU01101.1 hypothetical protein EOD41_10835 [Mucilaginibacter limnophilus]
MAIKRFLGENYGSLHYIEYVPAWQVLSFTPSSDRKIPAAGIQFYPGYGWQSIYCTRDTMGYRQVQENSVNGESYSHSVVGFVPGDEESVDEGLADLHGRQRYLLRITRPNGLVKIIGTPNEPLEVVQDANTQTTVPGRAGTALTFSGKTLRRALIVTP